MCILYNKMFLNQYNNWIVQANGIKIGPQHSPTSPGGLAGTGGQGSAQGGGCC